MNIQDLQKTLQEQMQREVYLMRELLSNMHQEEISLLLRDKKAVSELQNHRHSLLETLGTLRKTKHSTLSQIPYLPPSIEMTSLYEQLTTLSEKIHRQFSTNRKLAAHPEHSTPYHHEQKHKAQKTKLATIQLRNH